MNWSKETSRQFIVQSLQSYSPDQSRQSNVALRAVAFVYRFGSSRNVHLDFHDCMVDGVIPLDFPLPDIGDRLQQPKSDF
jgi:hypothetical protein